MGCHSSAINSNRIKMEVKPMEIAEEYEELGPKEESPIVLSWGRFDFGTLLAQSEEAVVDGIATYQPENRVILQISSNEQHTACLTSTGDLYLCGINEDGQVSVDLNEERVMKPRRFDLGNNRATSVSVGFFHTVCITASGVAVSFGGNEVGQLGHSQSKHTKVPLSKVDFINPDKHTLILQKVSCGNLFTLFLTTTGEVYGCGSGLNLGNPSETDKCVAERVEGLVGSNIVAIACGAFHALALTSDGELYTFGSNQFGQCGFDTTALGHIQTPKLVPLPKASAIGKVIGVAAGEFHSMVWTDTGVVLGSGSNKYGQLGSSAPRLTSFTILENNFLTTTSSETEGCNLTCHCIQAVCGRNHSLILTLDPTTQASRVFAFGSNTFNQCQPTSTATLFRIPTELSEMKNWNIGLVLYLAAGGDQSFLVAAPPSSDSRVSVVMRRHFSTVASRSVVAPMSASEVLGMIRELPNQPSVISNIAVGAIMEIFSSSSLLAGSFKLVEGGSKSSSDNSTVIDFVGLENTYTALIASGQAIIVKLLASLETLLAELTRVLTQLQQQATDGAAVQLPESILRNLLIIWLCPLNAEAVLSRGLFIGFVKLIIQIPTVSRRRLFDSLLIPHCPSYLLVSRILRPLHSHISYCIQTASDSSADSNLPTLCLLVNWLYAHVKGKDVIPIEQFYNPVCV